MFTQFNGSQQKKTYVNEKIIKLIDNKHGQNINIKMDEITAFEWDKMVIFDVGSSNVEISKALGVEYNDSTDLISGMVFVYDNKIVHEEKVPYNPERPNKLQYLVENKPGEPSCRFFTPDDAIFIGSREEINGVYYYKIKPLKTN